MKKYLLKISAMVIALSLLLPMTAQAAGNPNIGGGGGGLGEGVESNYWNENYEGVRVTIVDGTTGVPVCGSIDLSNCDTSVVYLHFGKVCKTQYRNGAGLSPQVGSYFSYTPSSPLPRIINCALYTANIENVKRYFTDEQVLRFIAGKSGMSYDSLIAGDYKILVEPIAYVVFGGVWTAMTATEAALYNQLNGGSLRMVFVSLVNKNLPLAIFLERDDLGYPAWSGGNNVVVEDSTIISALGVGIVKFTDEVSPPLGPTPDYTYRTDTDVITSVYVGGGEANPDEPVTVSFNIGGTVYNVSNVYYPEGGQQLVWVKWHTPTTPRSITIAVSAGGKSLSKSIIRCNIVDLFENPPPNPVADDRNDSYNRALAIMPANDEKTSAAWNVWRCIWHENWEWDASWDWEDVGHKQWVDKGEWVDNGWWEYYQDGYYASMSASASLTPDALDPTAYGDVIKSGYGVNERVSAVASTNNWGAVTKVQNAQSYFPEFYYKTYWRNLERTSAGTTAEFQFKQNQYSTYRNRTHFTPVWMKDGSYVVYTWVFDMWTPMGMLSTNISDGVTINGNLWSDWHIAPQNPR